MTGALHVAQLQLTQLPDFHMKKNSVFGTGVWTLSKPIITSMPASVHFVPSTASQHSCLLDPLSHQARPSYDHRECNSSQAMSSPNQHAAERSIFGVDPLDDFVTMVGDWIYTNGRGRPNLEVRVLTGLKWLPTSTDHLTERPPRILWTQLTSDRRQNRADHRSRDWGEDTAASTQRDHRRSRSHSL